MRAQLQEALNFKRRELTHPELGVVSLPENLQILFTHDLERSGSRRRCIWHDAVQDLEAVLICLVFDAAAVGIGGWSHQEAQE